VRPRVRGVAMLVEPEHRGGIERMVDRVMTETADAVKWRTCVLPNAGRRGALSYALSSARAVIWTVLHRPDVVMSDRIHSGLTGSIAARLCPRRCRHVTWVYGSELLKPSRLMLKRFVLRSSHVIAITAWAADRVAQIGMPLSLAVVRPGVDVDYWSHRDPGEEDRVRRLLPRDGKHIVLSVARIERNARHKGLDRVNAAVAMLARQGLPVTHLIVGSGSDERWLKDQIEQNGASGITVRIRDGSDATLRACYQVADLMAMPSVPELRGGVPTAVEGFGLVFLEAAASGCPSIGSTHGGAPEAIACGRSGWTCDGSVDATAQLIREMTSGERRLEPAEIARWAAANSWPMRKPKLLAAILGKQP
jgi:phosphatidyl-myo-inositol dimannoside synthase